MAFRVSEWVSECLTFFLWDQRLYCIVIHHPYLTFKIEWTQKWVSLRTSVSLTRPWLSRASPCGVFLVCCGQTWTKKGIVFNQWQGFVCSSNCYGSSCWFWQKDVRIHRRLWFGVDLPQTYQGEHRVARVYYGNKVKPPKALWCFVLQNLGPGHPCVASTSTTNQTTVADLVRTFMDTIFHDGCGLVQQNNVPCNKVKKMFRNCLRSMCLRGPTHSQDLTSINHLWAVTDKRG